MPFELVNDSKGIGIKDSYGEFILNIKSIDEIDYMMELIKQSYKYNINER